MNIISLNIHGTLKTGSVAPSGMQNTFMSTSCTVCTTGHLVWPETRLKTVVLIGESQEGSALLPQPHCPSSTCWDEKNQVLRDSRGLATSQANLHLPARSVLITVHSGCLGLFQFFNITAIHMKRWDRTGTSEGPAPTSTLPPPSVL